MEKKWSKLKKITHNTPLFKNKRNMAVLVIFLAILFLRIYEVPQLFYFGIDEEYQSLLAWSQIKDFHPIWIGLSAGSTGFYVGPGLVYLHGILLFFTNGDPVILAYAAVITGVITTITIYYTTNHIFGKKPALVATILYGFSAFMNYYDRRFWNPTFVPLISLLMFYSFVKVQKNPWWWMSIALLIGVSFHIHASLLIFTLITLLFLVRYIQSGKKIPLKIIFVSIVAFTVIYSPLIVYDLAKNFENLRTPVRLLQSGTSEMDTHSIVQHSILLFNTLSTALFNGIQSFHVIITFLFLLSTLFFSKTIHRERNHQQPIAILTLLLIVYMLSFIFFPGEILDYYALGIIPLFFISISVLLDKLPNLFLVCIVFIFLFLNVPATITRDTKGGLTAKKEFIQRASKLMDNRKFYLDTSGPYLYNGGWRYLFQVYGKAPISSRADDMFGWIYPEEISSVSPSIKMVITEGQKLSKVGKPIEVVESGIYSASIYEN